MTLLKELKRCDWCTADPLYLRYHDDEWGVPVFDEQALFERLVLESMQAGLSWLTILKKRDHMQRVFFNFDPSELARADEHTILGWLNDAGVIRHRGKLEAMVNNAQLMLEEQDFSKMLWQFSLDHPASESTERLSQTAASKAMSISLKKSGYRFVGPTICYAFMQSVGMVNDHSEICWRHVPCGLLNSQALEQVG